MGANEKVLIIGGAGYIGIPISSHLLFQGYKVHCLDLFLYNNQDCILHLLSNPNYEIIHGDFACKETLGKALKDVDYVILLAGLVGDPITKKYPLEAKEINEHAYCQFIHFIENNPLHIKQVIFISTCSNYGYIDSDTKATETHKLNPLSAYAKAKVRIEEQLLSLKNRVDFSITILRFATAFGLSPRMRFDLTVNHFTRDLFMQRPLLVYDAHTWRPYCHVKDFAKLISKTINAPDHLINFEVFNAGGDNNNYSKAMVIDEISKFITLPSIEYKEHGNDPRNYQVDFSKVRDVLNFEPLYQVKDGVQEILSALKLKLFNDIESHFNLYHNHEINYTLGHKVSQEMCRIE